LVERDNETVGRREPPLTDARAEALPNRVAAVTHAGTATWRSGYAAVCKTVYPGSIPGVASTISPPLLRPARFRYPARRAGHVFQTGVGFVICEPSSRRAGYSPVAQR